MRVIDLINYLAVIAVFADFLCFPRAIFGFADFRGPYVFMILILVILLVKLKKIFYNKYYIVILMVLIGFSIINVFLSVNSFSSLMKQLVGIGLSSTVFYCVIVANGRDIIRLFKIYLNIAFFVGLIGIIQQISFVIGFQPGYDFSYFMPPYWQYVTSGDGLLLRINSITLEPSGFCMVMLPAFFVAITTLIPVREKTIRMYSVWQAAIVASSVLLSFSSIGYIGVFSSVLLIVANNARKKKYFALNIIIIFVSIIVAGYILNNIEDVKSRAISIYDFSTGAKQMGETNQSAIILFSNGYIALKSFIRNPLFGSGLGSHELSYYAYIEEVLGINKNSPDMIYKVFRNVSDANSLFLRLMSETGLVGLLIVLAFMVKYYLPKTNDQSGCLWIISNAILTVFIMRLIRVGHYFDSGFFFFLWIYYFSKVNSTKAIEVNQHAL